MCVLLGVACAGAAATAPAATTRGSASPVSGSTSVAHAAAAVAEGDSLFFANRYADAERAYARAARDAPDDPLGHAAYALYLNYRVRFDAARGEAARAVAAGPQSARAFAVLCRVDDWSGSLPAAVAAGRRAVALDGADALAHLFLAEALADSGDYDGSRSEIAAASGLLSDSGTAYERAEVHREEGNLARDQGNPTGELSAFQAAYQAQPRWAERSAEVASAYIDNGNLEGAHGALGRAVGLAPDDPVLLSSLGRVALLQADAATADAAFTALLRLQPQSAPVLDGAAEVAMAVHHDPQRAAGLLTRALDADPGDTQAAAYLLWLARDVAGGGDEAGARATIAAAALQAARDDLAPGRHRSADPIDPDLLEAAHATAALQTVNATRAAAGLPPVGLDSRLSQSAAAHCFYWLFNNDDPAVAKLGIHHETLGSPGFSGVRPADRAQTFGWNDGQVGEDITHRGSAVAAVHDWVDSVYHRFAIVRPDLRSIGYADCGIGPLPMEDMEFGFVLDDTGARPPVAYPAAGQAGVPTTFVDDELPDPVPPGKPRTTGYPVTVTFDAVSDVQLVSFTLTGPDGVPLPAYLLAPSRDTENSASLLPTPPLRPGARYTAHIVATVDGRRYDRSWSFTAGT